MKALNKYIGLFLFGFFSLISHASTVEVNKEDLINKMAENNNVKLFFEQRINSLFNDYGLNIAAQDEDKITFANAKDNFFQLSNETMKSVLTDFPEFANYNSVEKAEILKSVFNTPIIINRAKAIAKCIGVTLLSYLGCVYGALPLIEARVWGFCFAAAVIADIVVAITTPAGAASLNMLTFRTEATLCYELAAAAVVTATPGIEANCATGATAAFVLCLVL